MDFFAVPISALLPHRGTMLLVERLLAEGPESVRVETTIRRDMPFVTDEGFPAWAGIELMAQCIGAWAGIQRLRGGGRVELGFLVGTRRYECLAPVFPVGARLEIHAQQELVAENGLAVFVCTITREGQPVATAQLNVFQPKDVQRYLEGGTP